jgi:hypothetical protein
MIHLSVQHDDWRNKKHLTRTFVRATSLYCVAFSLETLAVQKQNSYFAHPFLATLSVQLNFPPLLPPTFKLFVIHCNTLHPGLTNQTFKIPTTNTTTTTTTTTTIIFLRYLVGEGNYIGQGTSKILGF